MCVALVGCLFVLSIFAGRLVQMQGLDAAALAKAALNSRTLTVTLAGHRADITDIHNVTLATTVERFNILVDQTKVSLYRRKVGEDWVLVGRHGAAEDLAPLLGLSVAGVEAKLTGHSLGAYLAKGVTPETERSILHLGMAGIGTEPASRRIYSGGATAANVLGFLTPSGQAFGGIESAFNAELAGKAGFTRYEQGQDGARIPMGDSAGVAPQAGTSITLTLDRDLQWEALDLISKQVRATGADSGTVVMLDVHTSQILAMATAPTYDANNPGASSPANRNDRPLEDVFEPGSTAKVMSLAAAIQEKVATPQTPITVPPTLRRGGTTFRDAEPHGTEKLTVAGVLAHSSNMGTILTAERVPAPTMYAYQRAFGLGRKIGLGLAEQSGQLAPWQSWSDSQRYTVLYGQGLSVNAVQAASVFATIANDGVRIPPRIVAGSTGPDGAFQPSRAPAPIRVVSAQTAQQVRSMMESVVSEQGTAAAAAIEGVRVAGKTGTAQAIDPRCGCYRGAYTASFIGMAPADRPALVIAVILQAPKKGHFGGQVAAPVFQQLMKDALKARKAAPTGQKASVFPLTWK